MKQYLKEHPWARISLFVILPSVLIIIAIIVVIVVQRRQTSTDYYGPNVPRGSLVFPYIAQRSTDSKYQIVMTLPSGDGSSATQFTQGYSIMFDPRISSTDSSLTAFATVEDARAFAQSPYNATVVNKAYDAKTAAANTVYNTFTSAF
jgi:hypothetical protein